MFLLEDTVKLFYTINAMSIKLILNLLPPTSIQIISYYKSQFNDLQI